MRYVNSYIRDFTIFFTFTALTNLNHLIDLILTTYDSRTPLNVYMLYRETREYGGLNRRIKISKISYMIFTNRDHYALSVINNRESSAHSDSSDP